MNKLLILIILMICVSINSSNAQTILSADIYASYFGGSGEELSSFVAIDNQGNVIIAGTTSSRNLTVKPATLKKYGGGEYDGFVAKLSPDMKNLLFLTYLGAAYAEIRNVTVDANNNIYITGNTSNNFPVTGNALYKTYGGGIFDGFICKYNPEGQLLYSSYIGGNAIDIGMTLSVQNENIILLAGVTESGNFPLNPASGYTNKGSFDVFISKLNISTNSLDFSTCVGGSKMDFPATIKTDKSGNIYLSGQGTLGFPIIKGFNLKSDTFGDGFIMKYSANGEMIYSSMAFNSMVSIDVNDAGEVYFAGEYSSSGPVCSDNAFFKSCQGGSDIIIGKVNSTGDSLLYLSYFGGNANDNQNSIYCIGNDKVMIAGLTKSPDFPITVDAANKTVAGADITISVLDIAQKQIIYSNYMGGSANEEIWNSALQNDSTFFISATSKSTDFPVSSDAYTKAFQGVTDAVMAKIKLKIYQPASINTGTKLNKINVYPNPTKGIFNLHFNNAPTQESFVEIYNLLGTQVFSKTFQNTYSATINLSGYSKGIYYVKIIADGASYQEKIVKE
jgi:hypothetical protein